jgi:hypothetical protein
MASKKRQLPGNLPAKDVRSTFFQALSAQIAE